MKLVQESVLPFENRFVGIYRGVCVKDDDPLVLRRIKVRVFEIYGNKELIPDEDLPWAFPCLPPGSAPTPKVGDLVWVVFEHGHPHYPVWLGIFYPQPYIPYDQSKYKYNGGPGEASHLPYPAKTADKKPTVQLYSTPGGHFIIMSDEENKRYIKILDSKGNYVLIDTENNKLEIYMDTTGEITIKQNCEINLEDNLTKSVKGNENDSIQGSKSESIGGSLTLNITGNCNITCSGTVTIQSSSINLGSSGAKSPLLNSGAVSIFNDHTHSYDGGETGPPNQQMGGSVQTSATRAN